jgi:hypothetical protein
MYLKFFKSVRHHTIQINQQLGATISPIMGGIAGTREYLEPLS